MAAPSLNKRFTNYLANTDRNTGCWVWKGKADHHGYGRVIIDGASTGAHRAIYQYLVGKIPEGLVLDHLCRNTLCVNPDHLEPVTNRENTLRGDIGLKVGAYCRNGHLISSQHEILSVVRNGRSSGGSKRCRHCLQASEKRRKPR